MAHSAKNTPNQEPLPSFTSKNRLEDRHIATRNTCMGPDPMAANTSLSEEALLCPICCHVYNLPVRLTCGHHSCKVCLEKLWDRGKSRACPVCHTRSTSEKPPIDLALKIAADSFQKQRTCEEREQRCSLHNEKCKLFCRDEEVPICVICQTSRRHKTHDCCPIEEASLEKRIEISDELRFLQKQMKVLTRTKEQWAETKNYVKTQADEDEKVMKEEFKRLHQFLWQEEKVRVTELRQEEEQRTQLMSIKLELIEEKIKTLSSIISDMKSSISAGDETFLQEYKQIKCRSRCNFLEPESPGDILIDSAHHLGLLNFRIWRKMVELVQCVPFTLDPNTAQSNLILSDELTSVRYGSKRLLPDNAERCNSRICVLGATGFVSGKHSWVVEVGHGKDWYIGVARESIKRKTTIFLNPGEGFWVIGLCNGETYWAQTSPRTKLAVKKKPERITVELDYEKGKVAFINTVDSTPIHIFKDKFTERLFPYFAPGMNHCPLAICPLTISINVQES